MIRPPFRRHAAVRAAACGIALLAGGCTLTPPYQTPAAPIPTSYPADARPAPLADAGSPMQDASWCRGVPDPGLRRLVAAALEHNRDLKLAAARVEEARALHGIQSASRLPAVALEATATRPASQGRDALQVGASLSAYELDFFGRAKSLSDAALQEYLATEEAQRAARISLIAEVARGYVAERTAAARIALAERVKASRGAALALLERRMTAGASSPLDVAQARSLIGNAETDLIEQQAARTRAGHALALLTGYTESGNIGGGSERELEATLFEAGWGKLRPGLPSELLMTRPDIVAVERRLQAANAQIGAARAAFFPSIRLTAMGGVASDELGKLFTLGSVVGQLAPQISLPLFDGGRNQANLDLARARETVAVVEYERTIQTAFREVSDALAGQELANRDVAARKQVRDLEDRRLGLTKRRYLAGSVGYLDVLDAERSLFAAEQAALEARRARLENAIGLYRALGGCPVVAG